jgi:S-adenosylmethionine:tRNA ribosyltransferase-isomerase
MRVDLFDFELPPERIALHPARPRDSARLLYAPADGEPQDLHVRDLPSLLRRGDVLVVNDTQVIAAALMGVRPARGDGPDVAVDVNLHRREGPDAWRAFARPGKRLRVGDALVFDGVRATIAQKGDAGEVLLRFDRGGAALDDAIANAGAAPLPPYILAQRDRSSTDTDDYQTIFAKRPGAVAAPTAGLHFTPALLAQLDAMGVERVALTLHVSAGTFLPVKAEDTGGHAMHAEWREVSEDAAFRVRAARGEGRRVIAVGTTALRSLESAIGPDGAVRSASGETSIFITPGHRFRAVDGLWTNFHLPRSTLLMLVAAFAGLERVKALYEHAIAAKYRFYSFGDACLFFRDRDA